MPALTHFIGIPLSSSSLKFAHSAFVQSLPADVHSSIIRPYTSLHFTLGVLSADDEALSRSIELLQSAAEESYQSTPLNVSLEGVYSMNDMLPDARVLFTAPDASAESDRLGRICQRIRTLFAQNNLLQDHRPLKLHCTLLNTVYLKRPPARRRSRPTIDATSIIVQTFSATVPIDSIGLYEMGAKDGSYVCVSSVSLAESNR